MEDLIKALQIFLKYGNPMNPTYCMHDELRIMNIDPDTVSDDDKKELDILGFRVGDDEDKYFYSFRFGSA